MISKGTKEWNWALQHACANGFLNIVKLLVAKRANDFNSGLASSCPGGHLQVVEFMLRLGTSNYELLRIYKLNLENLVYDYALSLFLLQKISNVTHTKIQNELTQQKGVVNCFLIADLGQVLYEYIVTH